VASAPATDEIEAAYRAHSRRVLATLTRLLGSMDLAEEGLHEAFLAAAEQWPGKGMPDNPFSWLVSVGRFKTIDRLRRRARFDASVGDLARHLEERQEEWEPEMSDEDIRDDELRMIFICCHPALAPDAQVALALREVCGLRTEEIARAFIAPAPTIAQRIVRAKTRIRDENLPYEVPPRAELMDRVEIVLHVVYLIFNEGYSASGGDVAIRPDLCVEAIRLGRLMADLLPDPETHGLLALMLLQDSRRDALIAPDGNMVLFEDQDRSLWNRAEITEGLRLAGAAMSTGEVGPFALQAAIAALRAGVRSEKGIDWAEMVRLYDLLFEADPSAVVELNRAVAIAERDGAAVGLTLIDDIMERSGLQNYVPAIAARADLHRRLEQWDEARADYDRVLDLSEQGPERRFIERRLAELPR
jgi:RNA polymerase sigma-70 factor (ECF subfamily)